MPTAPNDPAWKADIAKTASDWEPYEKRGEFNLIVFKSGSRWGYVMKNPVGGSGGDRGIPSMKAAIAKAMRSVGWGSPAVNPDGKNRVWLVLTEFNGEDLIPKGPGRWLDLPPELMAPKPPLSNAEKWNRFTL